MSPKFADVDEEYAKNKQLKKEDVGILREWVRKQAHLPDVSELKLILFLHSCYYSIEGAKACIENYYTMRAHCPEFFANRNPNSKEIQQQLRVTLTTLLPIRTKEGYSVGFQKIMEPNPDLYVYDDQIKVVDMLGSLLFQQLGTVPGQVMVFDMNGLSMGHFSKVNFSSMRKYMFFQQEALPVRIKGIHMINVSSFTDKIMSLAKPMLKKEVADVMYFHQTLDSLYEYVPKEGLPNEYGGKAGTLKELQEQKLRMFLENADFFEEEERTEVADERKRLRKLTDVNKVFGIEGTFKKLEID